MYHHPYQLDEPAYIIQPPDYDEEDLQQEAALLRLEGIKPSMTLLRKKAKIYTEYLFSGDVPLATPLFRSPTPPLDVIEALILWASQQDPEVNRLIINFLDDPGEEVLNQTLKELSRRGLLAKSTMPTTCEMSLSKLIFEFLETPREIEEIYEFVRSIGHVSKRPEAAVRQILRRFVQKGDVVKTEAGYVRCNK